MGSASPSFWKRMPYFYYANYIVLKLNHAVGHGSKSHCIRQRAGKLEHKAISS